MLSSFAKEPPSNAWKLAKEIEGVKIYTREMPSSAVKELMIKSVIKGNSLASFVALFHDVPEYDNWVYSCEKALLLQKYSETEIAYYIKSSFPWPLNDRDFVVKNKIWQDKKTLAFHSKSEALNNHLPQINGIVRITTFSAEWIITPAKNGNFVLQYTFSSDPGGNLPAWLVNSFIDFGPLKTIKAMESEAQKPKYAKVKFNYIKELP